jgi:hypothetical protein
VNLKLIYCRKVIGGVASTTTRSANGLRKRTRGPNGKSRTIPNRHSSLLTAANAFIEQEARRPQIAVEPLVAEAKRVEAKTKKLVRRVENTDDEAMANLYDKRARELQKEHSALMVAINEAKARNRKPLNPLPLERAQGYLADLRETLTQEIPMAAKAIRQLTGPITIRQEAIPGKKNLIRWIATFSPDLTRLLRSLKIQDPAISAFVGAVVESVNAEVVTEAGEATTRKIDALVKPGLTEVEIAAAAGCGIATVSRIKRKLKQRPNDRRRS